MFLLGFDFAYAGGVFLLTFWIGFDFAYAGGVFLLTVIDFCLIFFGFFDDGGGVFLLTIVDFCWIFFAIVLVPITARFGHLIFIFISGSRFPELVIF